MTEQRQAEKVVKHMLEHDAFSAWLGVKLLEIKPGKAMLQMTVRKEMLNGFYIMHGGISFAFADSALAFASNSHGRISVVIQAVMSYPAAVVDGDVLTAVARELNVSDKIGSYDITITKQDGAAVGLFRGTVYRTGKKFFDEKDESEKEHE